MVSVIEPTECCCGEKEGNKLVGNITKVTLWKEESGGACVPVHMTAQDPPMCCCGYKEGNATDVKQRKVCAPGASGLGKEKDEMQRDGDNGALNESTEKQNETENNGKESDGDDSVLGEPTETQVTEERPVEESEDDGGLSQLTDRHIKDDSVLEDIIAAFVFLFVGAVLLLIKSRLFKFTKKKRQQEDKDMQSQETLVDETGI